MDGNIYTIIAQIIFPFFTALGTMGAFIFGIYQFMAMEKRSKRKLRRRLKDIQDRIIGSADSKRLTLEDIVSRENLDKTLGEIVNIYADRLKFDVAELEIAEKYLEICEENLSDDDVDTIKEYIALARNYYYIMKALQNSQDSKVTVTAFINRIKDDIPGEVCRLLNLGNDSAKDVEFAYILKKYKEIISAWWNQINNNILR